MTSPVRHGDVAGAARVLKALPQMPGTVSCFSSETSDTDNVIPAGVQYRAALAQRCFKPRNPRNPRKKRRAHPPGGTALVAVTAPSRPSKSQRPCPMPSGQTGQADTG